MSDYTANKFLSPHSLLFLLFFWIALLLFGISFWQYKEPDSVKGLIFYVSFAVLMIIITYREIEQAKKRIYDKKLLYINNPLSHLQDQNDQLLRNSDEKFLKLSKFTIYAIVILLIPSAVLITYNMIKGIKESNHFVFIAMGLFIMNAVSKDIKLIKQRISSE